jgi:hypothetical protein
LIELPAWLFLALLVAPAALVLASRLAMRTTRAARPVLGQGRLTCG